MPSSTRTTRAAPRLVFMLGEERQEFELKAPSFSIGRKPDKDLVLINPHVSRDHAVILAEAGGYVLEDQGSKHGTFVNGERVTRRYRLERGDRIEFGGRGEGCLVFDSDRAHSSDARSFLTQIAARRPSSEVPDLGMLTLFMEAARKLNTGGVLEDVLVTLLDTLLKITGSERGYVFSRRDDGGFILAAGRNEKGETLREDATISHSILHEAATSGSEFMLTGFDDLAQLANRQSVVAQQLRTVICIPLPGASLRAASSADAADQTQDEIRTLLYLDSHRLAGKLSPVSHDILRAIAREAATLLENARLVQSDQAMRRYQQELSIAASIQQRLMMVEIPQVPFARVDARSLPCAEVGGDFFDVLYTGEQLSVVVADVCGKGISAALLASIIQGMLYSNLLQGLGLAEAVSAVNRFLCERNLGEKYATLLVARLSSGGRLEYVNCGHVPPLAISAGAATPLPSSNLPVGLFPEATFTSGSLSCSPGDRLLLVTDGVTEAEGQDGEFFGYDRLQAAAATSPGVADLLERVTGFCQGVPLRDDCTALELQYQG